MIVPDGTPASPTKTDTGSSPPAYQYQGYSSIPSSSQQPQPTPPGAVGPTTAIFVKHPYHHRFGAPSSTCKRFTKALLAAVLVYALVSAFFGSLTWRMNGRGDWGYWGDSDPEWPGRSDWITSKGSSCTPTWDDSFNLMNVDIDLPSIINSPDWNAPFHTHTSLILDPKAIQHLIVGNRAYGEIEFIASHAKSEDITVDIIAYYYQQSVRDRVSICKLNRKDGAEGVGIYVRPSFPFFLLPLTASTA